MSNYYALVISYFVFWVVRSQLYNEYGIINLK
jgi:hypothetical protein